MKLYNTLTRQIEEFIPISPPNVGLYACGPTVYDYTHIGHLRKYTMDDVLIRMLRQEGFLVKFVQNITDVGHLTSDGDTGEDKLEKGARKFGQSVWDIAHKFEDYFFYSMDEMGNLRPDISCRATEHIQEQLELVLQLEKKGFAYVIEGDGVYFDTSKFKDYGKMAKLDLENLQAGVRVEQVEGKRNPTDFAIWKFERPGENRAMVWSSPWAERSFPGWHIECTAMSMKYLGEQFDIHTGGVDHIPVHHTNEIAQAEAATSKVPFVRFWVHHNFLRVNDEKMSKSLGNIFTIDDVKQKGFSPRALRLLFLMSHYRSEMNFTWESLVGAQKAFDNLTTLITQFRNESERTVLTEEKMKKVDGYRTKFFTNMGHDLNTPQAVAVMWEVVKSNIPGRDKYDLLMEFDTVLGLGLAKVKDERLKMKDVKIEDLPEEAQALLKQREEFRQAEKWAAADQARDKLREMGYEVVDGKGGVVVRQIGKIDLISNS